MTIAVVGAGAFGTALSISLASVEPVILWGHDAAAMADMARGRINTKRLPAVGLPDGITATSDISQIDAAEIVLLCLPTQSLQGFVRSHADQLGGKVLVTCCKGIDLDHLTGPATGLQAILPKSIVAHLTGPSFAIDIARGLPTALTLACRDAEVGALLQQRLSTPTIRLYRTTDVVGAELGGALKNVIALATGACIGIGYGDSARAALMTRGFAEMQRLATAIGADPRTLDGLSGLGDLALTCNSDHSRNFRHGLALGRGDDAAPTETVEGVATARAVLRLSDQLGIDLPIARMVADVVSGRHDITTALDTFFARPLKEE